MIVPLGYCRLGVLAHRLADGAIVEKEIVELIVRHEVGLAFPLGPDHVPRSQAVEVSLRRKEPGADDLVEARLFGCDIGLIGPGEQLGRAVAQIEHQVTVEGTFLDGHSCLLQSRLYVGNVDIQSLLLYN